MDSSVDFSNAADWATAGALSFIIGVLVYSFDFALPYMLRAPGITLFHDLFAALGIAISFTLIFVTKLKLVDPIKRGDTHAHITLWAIILALLGLPFSEGVGFIVILGAEHKYRKTLNRLKASGGLTKT